MKEILSERKLGEKLTLGVQAEADEVGLYLASEDVSASCAFLPDEWDNFVEAVKAADQKIQDQI
ncbi:hypothetical protein [Halarsenatibacter silvermanii]|uniref:Uncharacterized protein n=1 Tax=Halarsenatibacter silvermanii TaxID=321763 RepID=A0A1G9RK43_9FIRM|nr:hypothetical protein [Halarsenatibacter silvermanii]SDM23593.1 hypothetical protein SAMN04488692_12233 [Halarsenatibacter silvermanii]